MAEAELLKSFTHDHVVTMHGMFQVDRKVHIVLDYLAGAAQS